MHVRKVIVKTGVLPMRTVFYCWRPIANNIPNQPARIMRTAFTCRPERVLWIGARHKHVKKVANSTYTVERRLDTRVLAFRNYYKTSYPCDTFSPDFAHLTAAITNIKLVSVCFIHSHTSCGPNVNYHSITMHKYHTNLQPPNTTRTNINIINLR